MNLFPLTILLTGTFSLLWIVVSSMKGAYTDEEDQKYAESRFLEVGAYPQLRKVVPNKDMVVHLNVSGICDLKPGDFVALCEAVGNYKKSRFPKEPYGVNESIVPEKCRQHPVKFHWEKFTPKPEKSTNEQANYFTTEFYWENKTESHDPLVQARKCPTTRESPRMWLSDGREKFAVFMYMRSCPGRTHLRLEDYLFFAQDYHQEG